MPIKWDTESMYILACQVIEYGGIQNVNYEKIIETWPCEDLNDRPSIFTLRKRITELHNKIAKIKERSGGSSTPRTSEKSASRGSPKTPTTKRSAPLPKTPASKKRKLLAPKRKRQTDESEVEDMTSSDEDLNHGETTEDEDGSDTTPPSSRRILPARAKKATPKKYTEETDMEGKDAGARSDSDGDEDFDPSGGGKDVETGSSRRANALNRDSLLAQGSLSDDETVVKAKIGDDAKSTATSSSFKSAREHAGGDDDDGSDNN